MYIVGAQIISHVTGTPFQTYITRNIISPLGLNWTTYDITEAEQSGKLAEGFLNIGVQTWNEHGKIRSKPIPFWVKKGGDDLIAGAGGVISNAKDMVCVLCYVPLETLILEISTSRQYGCRRYFYQEGLLLQMTPSFLLLLLRKQRMVYLCSHLELPHLNLALKSMGWVK
jgi:CubicO group peptidase (beta-lactamase class C family)